MADNPYTWARRSRPDSPVTSAELYRHDTYIGVLDLEPGLPFHADLLNKVCDTLHRAERDNQPTDRTHLRAVAEHAITTQETQP